jgi:hypothetical protein
MKFFFLLENLNDIEPTAVNDQHTCVVFAQGLRENGIPFCGNRNFLQFYGTNDSLIKEGTPDTSAIIVTTAPHRFQKELVTFHKNGHRIIIFNTRDEWNAHEFDEYIPLTTHYYRSSYHGSNTNPIIRPFAFALNHRILNATKSVTFDDWSKRAPVILEAHRVTNHSIRNYVKQFYASGRCPVAVESYNDKFTEPEKGTEEYFHWCQTGRRHSTKYYEKLMSVQMLDAHGGYFQKDRIVQIDSWKLWEGFAAGCLVIAPDFKYYNIQLPYELIGLKHYIPIRYDRIQLCYEILNRLTVAQKQEIAMQGHLTVRKHYSPKGMADYICGNL